MKFLWLEGDIEIITPFNLKQAFGVFILNRDEEDMQGNLDELPEKLEDINEGIDYTSNHENWIRDTSNEVLTELKGTSLNELFELYVIKKDRKFYSKLGEIPKEFLLKHINNRDLSQEFIGKVDEDIDIMRGVKEITNSQILNEFERLEISKLGNEYLKIKYSESKNILTIDLKYHNPELNLEVLGSENFSFKKYSKPKTIINSNVVSNVKLDKEFIEDLNEERRKKKGFQEEYGELVGEETKEEFRENLREIENKKKGKVSKKENPSHKIIKEHFLSDNSPLLEILPNQIYDPYNLYELHLKVEFRFNKIGKVEEVDEREYGYSQISADDDDEEELGNYIEVKANINLKEIGSYVLRIKAKETSPYNRARDAYVKSLKNRLETLEDAIEDIPPAEN